MPNSYQEASQSPKRILADTCSQLFTQWLLKYTKNKGRYYRNHRHRKVYMPKLTYDGSLSLILSFSRNSRDVVGTLLLVTTSWLS